MAAVAVFAELKFRDGSTEKVRVNVEKNLRSLIGGVRELNGDVARLLSELVERERARGACAEGEEEEEEEEDGESDEEDPEDSELHPPAKRSKT